MEKDYSQLFIHETDKAALNALKGVPGFNLVMKKYMEVYDENVLRVENMSTNIRISEKQMPKYYGMLVDVCRKLKIDIPDFYMKSDVNPDAYIIGETKPTIVITSGLFETFPDEIIPTVIAQQCGHIICHHTFYTTLAYDMLNGMLFGVSKYFSISEIAVDAINAALMYWKRCSEISADRVAVIYDGGVDKIIEVCMRFAGFSNNIRDYVSTEEFISQAEEYNRLVEDSRWNKALEVSMYMFNSHPIFTLRANEVKKWSESADFMKILKLYQNEKLTDIPMLYDGAEFIGRNMDESISFFKEMGFDNISTERVVENKNNLKENQVSEILINNTNFVRNSWSKNDDTILIKYYLPLSESELIASHAGQHRMPVNSASCFSEQHTDIAELLKTAGFTNIKIVAEERERKNLFVQDGDIFSITVDGAERFSKGDWVNEDAEIIIIYNKLVKKQ